MEQSQRLYEGLFYYSGLENACMSDFQVSTPMSEGDTVLLDNTQTSREESQIRNNISTLKREQKKKTRLNEAQPKGADEKISESSQDSFYGSEKKSEGSIELNHLSKKISKNTTEKNDKKSPRTRRTWDKQEDDFLLSQVRLHGPNWSLISHNMKGKRTGKQIRDRYLNKLHPSINNSRWTEGEDQQLLYLFKIHGRKWCEIARCLPGRTETMVKNRFYTNFKEHLSGKTQPNEAKPAENNQQEVSQFLPQSEPQSTACTFQEPKDFLNGVDAIPNTQNPIFQNRLANNNVQPLLYMDTNRFHENQMNEVSFIDFSVPTKEKYDFFEEDGTNNFNTEKVELFQTNENVLGIEPKNTFGSREKEIRLQTLMSRLANIKNIYYEIMKEIDEVMQSE